MAGHTTNSDKQYAVSSDKQYTALEEKYVVLQNRIAQVQVSNSSLRDEVVELKRNYKSLVEGLNKRFEYITENFRK
tara:strand:- start:1072 stop:1299 length:228 start_codon:yes stop_codon:yes gene_type:complete